MKICQPFTRRTDQSYRLDGGAFPTLIAIITMFFVTAGTFQSFFAVLILTLLVLFGVALTFLMSGLLSKTMLKGIPSSFTLELPPYRRPQIGKVLIRSILDRTIFVLGRAVTVAAPAGFIIWLLANILIGDTSLLLICSNFLDPFARFIGLDGIILMAFILGFPANEIVIPIILMAYLSTGKITEYESMESLKILLVDNGWTFITAICTMIFMICHFPCSTTILTIKKETQSIKWTLFAAALPTIIGIITCGLIANIIRLFMPA